MQGVTSNDIKARIRTLGLEMGFAAVGFARAEIGAAARQGLHNWLAGGSHGSMDYMARHAHLRLAPAELHPATRTVISVRFNYWPLQESTLPAEQALADPTLAYVSRYALGRDYHKTLRQRLQQLADRIAGEIGPCGHRVFVDSAPVMEVEFAQQATIGWRGKHTLLLTRRGSWHFLGELYTDLAIDPDPAASGAGDHCGRCTACLDRCPTQAIVAPYRVDARRCLSYLSIEHPGSIPEEFRVPFGNRIYGCDDCQLACPWNRFADATDEPDFAVRHGLDRAPLAELFAWSAADFADRLAGSPIRRIGHERWLRNIAVGLGNARRAAPDNVTLTAALAARRDDPSPLVREHVGWALAQQPADNTSAARWLPRNALRSQKKSPDATSASRDNESQP